MLRPQSPEIKFDW